MVNDGGEVRMLAWSLSACVCMFVCTCLGPLCLREWAKEVTSGHHRSGAQRAREKGGGGGACDGFTTCMWSCVFLEVGCRAIAGRLWRTYCHVWGVTTKGEDALQPHLCSQTPAPSWLCKETWFSMDFPVFPFPPLFFFLFSKTSWCQSHAEGSFCKISHGSNTCVTSQRPSSQRTAEFDLASYPNYQSK